VSFTCFRTRHWAARHAGRTWGRRVLAALTQTESGKSSSHWRFVRCFSPLSVRDGGCGKGLV
jgi:hypothetical protein